ncbi:MAG TPA: hypothetical protein VF469_10545 [Kofleriaceae bacterium]
MYRDDQEALQQRLEGTTREAERLRRENESMRAAVGRMEVVASNSTLALPPNAIYSAVDVRAIPLEERARLAGHSVTPFPVWAVGVLHVITLGLFPLIHFSMIHDRLPKASSNDPSAARAFWFHFIPYYNLYWVFFSALRLCDRLSFQMKLRGLSQRAPRGLVLAACIVWVIPYVNLLLGWFILWTIAVCVLQSAVNRVASLGPMDWDATVLPTVPAGYPTPAYPGHPANPGYAPPVPVIGPSAEQLAREARARTLVNWSHALGWGGLVVLIFGTGVAAAAAGGAAAAVVGVLSGICVIVGAILGQIGRGMQGRAI